MKISHKSFITNFIIPVIIFLSIMVFSFFEISKGKITDIINLQYSLLETVEGEVKSTLSEYKSLLIVGSKMSPLIDFISQLPNYHPGEEIKTYPGYDLAVNLIQELWDTKDTIDEFYLASQTSTTLFSSHLI